MYHRLAIALIALALPASAQHIDAFDWVLPDPSYGGLSGIEVSGDGRRFVAISDNGTLYKGTFVRGPNDRVQNIAKLTTQGIALEDGSTDGRKAGRDTEALVLEEDGSMFVALEGDHRVIALNPSASKVTASYPFGQTLVPRRNRGFEALAQDANGDLYALPESSKGLRHPFPILRLSKKGTWQHIADLPRKASFRPVGADFGPDGHLYILTRAFSGFSFTSRVERLTFAPNGIAKTETVFQSHPGQFDNLEGISVWTDRAGNLRLTMVSDDNFNRFQRTQIVEVTLR